MGYDVRGGPGSIRYSLTELERTTSMLRGAKEELVEGAIFLARAPGFPAAVVALGTVRLRQRVAGIEAGMDEVTALCSLRAAESSILALNVATARTRYEQAEAEAQRQMTKARGDALPLALMWELVSNKGRPHTQTTEDLINELPGFMGLPLGFLRDKEHGGQFEATVPDRLYPLLTDFLRDQDLVQLTPIEVVGQGPERVVEIDGSIDSLVELQKLAEREPPGSLLVTRVEGNQGPVYVLTIPGTQSDPPMDPEGNVRRLEGAGPGQEMGNPWDSMGIVEGMGNNSKNLMPSVEDALRQSGARNGDRVVVTGYSQGGIHAVNIVNDEHLIELFDFPHLSTYGSPTGRTPVPQETHALHLEDKYDMVPGTDGGRNPDERNRLTVVFDGPDGAIELGNDGFGEAHKLENYEAHAKELRGTTDPGVVESLGLLGALFGQSRQGKVRSFQLARLPKPRAKVPAKDGKHDRLNRTVPLLK
jgi:hypothetical protein